jgi:hypothetical protein
MLTELIVALVSGAAGAFVQHWLAGRREVPQLQVEAMWKPAAPASETKTPPTKTPPETAAASLLVRVENVGKRPVLLSRISLAVAKGGIHAVRTEELGSSSDLLDENMQVRWPHQIEAGRQAVFLINVGRIRNEIRRQKENWKTEVAARVSDRRTPGFFESRWIPFSTGGATSGGAAGGGPS